MAKKSSLKDYHRKRDFKVTSEPSGKKTKSRKNKTSKLSFVVQEHHARRLHYDFRLEWEGVLKSWAVPKGPSQEPGEKRLAVQTEDHPLEYGHFSGTIPKGEYGAGEVFIWDSGTWEPIGDPDEGFEKGHIEFNLKGKKLKGKWMLIRTRSTESKPKNNWLLLKRSDEKASSHSDSLKKTSKKKIKLLAKDPWPGFIEPQLPKLVTDVPEEAQWLHEMKFDGYRIQTHLRNKIAHLYTRRGNDWSNNFPHILKALGNLSAIDAIIDGEVVALDDKGKANFQKLQNSFKSKKDSGLRYYVFDLLYLNGMDLRDHPLIERKELLKDLIRDISPLIIYSEHLLEQGAEFFKVSCEHQLEGIVSKLIDSPYCSGRSSLWTKNKCKSRQEFVIGGFTDPQEGRSGLGALLLGIYEDDKLKYAGKVGTGFNQVTLKEIKALLSQLKQSQSPFEINSPKGKNIHWVQPIKVAEVSFAEWTDEGILRAPVFLGLREDKKAAEISKEIPIEPENKRSKNKVSSPDKILFEKEGITKQEVDDYYQTVAKHMLPYVKDRPLSLVRCPEGSRGTCFFQKHLTGKFSKAFLPVPIQEESGETIHSAIDSAEGLHELAQLNAYEIHLWNCHRKDTEHPDQIVMDFDPGPGVPWKDVIQAARELKALLEDLKLKSFVKSTGGKGLHVHIPINPIYDWDQVKSFSQSLALQLSSEHPGKYTTNMSKKLRKGKIFIDYLRNGYGATAVAPYSLRAKPMSSVALPLDWNELGRIRGPQEFSLRKAIIKIKRRKSDPWKGLLGLRQEIEILTPDKKRKAA